MGGYHSLPCFFDTFYRISRRSLVYAFRSRFLSVQKTTTKSLWKSAVVISRNRKHTTNYISQHMWVWIEVSRVWSCILWRFLLFLLTFISSPSNRKSMMEEARKKASDEAPKTTETWLHSLSSQVVDSHSYFYIRDPNNRPSLPCAALTFSWSFRGGVPFFLTTLRESARRHRDRFSSHFACWLAGYFFWLTRRRRTFCWAHNKRVIARRTTSSLFNLMGFHIYLWSSSLTSRGAVEAKWKVSIFMEINNQQTINEDFTREIYLLFKPNVYTSIVEGNFSLIFSRWRMNLHKFLVFRSFPIQFTIHSLACNTPTITTPISNKHLSEHGVFSRWERELNRRNVKHFWLFNIQYNFQISSLR